MTDAMAKVNETREKLKELSNKPGKGASKLGAEKLTPAEQRQRFEELAKEAGCDETSDERFDRALAALGE